MIAVSAESIPEDSIAKQLELKKRGKFKNNIQNTQQ